MKSLSEPIARKANAEDKVTGRFWEGRFGCQALLSEKSILAAMAYVDLNPLLAKVTSNIATSRHTSVKLRNQRLLKNKSSSLLLTSHVPEWWRLMADICIGC